MRPAQSPTVTIGTVAAVWRYPVKSMLGERVDSLRVDHRGGAGDRLWAVRDGQGKLGSGKNSRRFRRIDGLLGCTASYPDTGERATSPSMPAATPTVTLPTGRRVRADDAAADELLRTALGRSDVRLARETDVPHFDDAPVHLVTTAALRWLAAAVPGVAVDERRLRPNLVVSAAGDEPVEASWLGHRLRIGPDLVIEVTKATERCVMVGMAQSELPRSSAVLKAISVGNDLCLGVYARTVEPGVVRRGDRVLDLGPVAPAG